MRQVELPRMELRWSLLLPVPMYQRLLLSSEAPMVQATMACVEEHTGRKLFPTCCSNLNQVQNVLSFVYEYMHELPLEDLHE